MHYFEGAFVTQRRSPSVLGYLHHIHVVRLALDLATLVVVIRVPRDVTQGHVHHAK